MIIDIKDLENLPGGKLYVEFNEVIPGLETSSPITANIEVISNGVTIDVKGRVQSDISFECDRCLKEFLHHIDLNIDEKFVKGRIIDDNVKDLELKNENFIEELGDNEKIDLTDVIYQNIIINSPIKKLCDINCEGSEEFQKYVIEKSIDPRMQIFKDLKDKLK